MIDKLLTHTIPPAEGRKGGVAGIHSEASAREDSVKKTGRQQELAAEFERIFARQLVDQMTRNLFETDRSGTMQSGSSLYREHITDILSTELSRQEALGIAEIVRKQWKINQD